MATDNGEWSYADTDEEILTRIAWYYYNDGLTQNEIGEKLNMSRIKVSRLLESGRRSGIIQVRINSRYQGCLTLERQIKEGCLRLTWCHSFPIRIRATGWDRPPRSS